jgi:hypothetical protein
LWTSAGHYGWSGRHPEKKWVSPQQSLPKGYFLEAIMVDKTHQDLPNTQQPEASGCLPTIVRLIWLAAGNAFLVILTGLIIQKGTFSALDIIFWALVSVLVLVRYYDITRLEGLTAESEPATLQHWKHYTLILLLISSALWVIAHSIRYILPHS